MDGWERPDNAHAEAGWIVPTMTARHGAAVHGDDPDLWRVADVAPTLNVQDSRSEHHATVAVAYSIRNDAMHPGIARRPSIDADGTSRLRDPGLGVYEEIAPTLATGGPHAVGFDANYSGHHRVHDELSPPVKAGAGGGSSHPAVGTNLAVRRLTPRECERLMGWPDDYTRWTPDGTEIADSHRYRLCGNGVVSNQTTWIGHRLTHHHHEPN